MKTRVLLLVCTVIACLSALDVRGHAVVVHENITAWAASSALLHSPSYSSFLDENVLGGGPLRKLAYDGELKYPSEWMITGSAKEDADELVFNPGHGGTRVSNHFYDPLSGGGLTDHPTSGNIPVGVDSATWGSYLNSPGLNGSTYNEWAWQNAREYQWLALIQPNQANRDLNYAKMFRALGQVMHLLQDASQPQHTRNEQHLFPQSPLERYGKKQVHELNFGRHILDWRTCGFKRLKDFWDRDFYNWDRNNPTARDAQPLVDDADSKNPTKKLGLAEFSNGNLIGHRHSYREVISGGPFHYPFPSLFEGTDWQQLRADPSARRKFTTVPNIGSGYRYIVEKNAQGRNVTHHGAVTYLVSVEHGGAFNIFLGLFSADLDDPDVLKDYHDIMIPKAIEYSAGILDYFFRGRLETTLTVNTSGGYDLEIKNVSGQDLRGGEFHLYWDNESDTRTELLNPGNDTDGNFIITWGSDNPIANNATITATLKRPTCSTVKKYTLVYKGKIGVTAGGDALDPVEVDTGGNGIAIAAKSFGPPTLDCAGGTGDAPNYYSDPIPPQPTRVYFKELAAVEALLSGSNFDDADPTDPCLSDGMPLYDGIYMAGRAVNYGYNYGSTPERYYNVAGKLVYVWAYMYYDDPIGPSSSNPTWWFNMECFLNGDWISVFAGFKETGDTVVGSFIDYSQDPDWDFPILYDGPVSLCTEP